MPLRAFPLRASTRNARLRGAARLATDATVGLADLVEAVHQSVARVPGQAAPDGESRTTGITGLVYKTVRGVTRLVGGTMESLLSVLGPDLAPERVVPQRDALVAALNGVLGDVLVAVSNPLATPMTFRQGGRALPLDDAAALADRLPDESGTLLVLIHGLCMNDLQWTSARGGHGHHDDHGAALGAALGCTPVYLHYNSGVHVSINGRSLAHRLELLVERWPRPVDRVVLVGHSMGGLLARSAAYHGLEAGHGWVTKLTDMVFLGTPHHGAPLERAGNWVDVVLGATPYAAPFARLGKVRSAGITDLRHGNLLDEDWVGHDRFERRPDGRHHVPLPDHVRCFAAAASVSQKPGGLKERLLGDGLVPLDSALGQHAEPARCLAFAEGRQWVGYGINHLGLLWDPQVVAQVVRWLAPVARTECAEPGTMTPS